VQAEARADVRHNVVYNVVDGAFFGFGLGIASYQTVIPLFIATLTDSTILIGIIAAVHMVGWQLPQILTSGHVARMRRYKRFVILITIQERLPYLGLAVVALTAATLGKQVALILAFIFACWQSFGGGFTATAWQSMIAKIMPSNIRGTFYGVQSAAAYFLASLGAVIAGSLLQTLPAPYGYVACFALAAVTMFVSLGFLAQTREPEHEVIEAAPEPLPDYVRRLRQILREDANFRWFVIARIVSQVGLMATNFYAIYAVRQFNVSDSTIGVMTGTLLVAQGVGNIALGWIGDRFGHRNAIIIGALSMAGSAILAITARDTLALHLMFVVAGIGYAALWTTVLALTSQFGSPAERPYYIGLSNTLTAPATLLAPILGGWLADAAGFGAAFGLAAAGAVATALILLAYVREPQAAEYAAPVRVIAEPCGD
jgi:MFS family permease